MALYFLSYDLVKGKDYDKIYKELEKFNALRVLESVWCFKRFNTSSKDLRDHFKNFIDNDDRLLVNESLDWATFNALKTPNDL